MWRKSFNLSRWKTSQARNEFAVGRREINKYFAPTFSILTLQLQFHLYNLQIVFIVHLIVFFPLCPSLIYKNANIPINRTEKTFMFKKNLKN